MVKGAASEMCGRGTPLCTPRPLQQSGGLTRWSWRWSRRRCRRRHHFDLGAWSCHSRRIRIDLGGADSSSEEGSRSSRGSRRPVICHHRRRIAARPNSCCAVSYVLGAGIAVSSDGVKDRRPAHRHNRSRKRGCTNGFHRGRQRTGGGSGNRGWRRGRSRAQRDFLEGGAYGEVGAAYVDRAGGCRNQAISTAASTATQRERRRDQHQRRTNQDPTCPANHWQSAMTVSALQVKNRSPRLQADYKICSMHRSGLT